MKIPKFKIKKISLPNRYTIPAVIKFFKKLPKILGERAFIFFLILLFLALIFGGLVFYKYSILAQKAEPEIFEKPLKFKEETYQEVLKTWKERQKIFEETELKTYPDPFLGVD